MGQIAREAGSMVDVTPVAEGVPSPAVEGAAGGAPTTGRALAPQ